MSDKHTTEPWEMMNGGNGPMIAGGPSPDPITYARYRFLARLTRGDSGNPMWNEVTVEETTANARRIVACVNACAGIPTDELEAIAGWEDCNSIRMAHLAMAATDRSDEYADKVRND